jgi:hypothetical protein
MHPNLLRVLLAENGLIETGITFRSLCAQQGRALELVFVLNRASLSEALFQFHPRVSFSGPLSAPA